MESRPRTDQEVELLLVFCLKLVNLPAGMNAGLGWVWVEAPSDGDMARHFLGWEGGVFVLFLYCR